MESADTTVPSTVKQSYDNVGLFFLSYNVNPFSSRLCHIFEMESAPQFLMQPIGYGRSNHTYNSYLHSLTLNDSIGLDIRLPRGIINDIGTYHRTIQFAYPLVIHGMSRFDIMIAHCLGVVSKPVHNLSCRIRQFGFNEIGVVACRLTLKNVSVLKQNDILAILFAHCFQISAYPCERALHGSVLYVVVREEATMDITCLNDFQINSLLLGHNI